MNINQSIESHLVRFVDFIFANLPQKMPDPKSLKQCKVISHRGEYDNLSVYENTIEAFNRVKNHGVWGVELDIRWTSDLEPIVFHDATLKRLFGVSESINQLTLAEIKRDFPTIPSLAEVVERFGGKIHLMVEIKLEAYPQPQYQNLRLKEIFAYLRPKKDYHLLSLTPQMLYIITFIKPDGLVPITRLNFIPLSRLALKKRWGGIAGHYLLMTEKAHIRHKLQGQKFGTGFIESQNSLFREVNRGVDWIFSNSAVKLQKILNECISHSL